MKKLVLSIAALLAVSFTADAQTRKGTILLGAGSDLAGQTINDLNITPKVGYFVQDGVAIGAIIDFSNNTTNAKNNQNSSVNDVQLDASSSTLGAFVRYYVSNNVFAELGVTSTSGTNEVHGYKTDNRLVVDGNGNPILSPTGAQQFELRNEKEKITLSNSSTDVNVGLGYTLVFKEHFALEPYVKLSFVNGSETTYDAAGAAVEAGTIKSDDPGAVDRRYDVGESDISSTNFNLGLNFSLFF
jgi:hypothetical protein